MKGRGALRALLALAVAAGLAAALLAAAPRLVDARLNGLHEEEPPPVPARARELHRRLAVVDLHVDALLWDRNLRERGERGHADLPRLRAGNLALVGFGVVTRSPAGQNFDSNPSDALDVIGPLMFAQGRPAATWRSPRARALEQARALHRLAGADPSLRVVRSRADLDALLAGRAADPDLLGGFLALEGGYSLEGELEGLDALFEAGFRMLSPAHFIDGALGGSAHGEEKGGLTPLGRAAVARMEALGIALDLAHASPPTFDEALALATKPVFVSHSGVRGTCDNTRNLSDDQLRAVARTGGVVGIAFFEHAVCGRDAAAIARAARHAADVAGVGHVALGSDWDGAVATPWDATGLVHLTGALLEEGFEEEEVALLMGGNALRALRAVLPER